MHTRIVAFCGPEGAGKSTAAKHATGIMTAAVIPFALPLKEMLLALGVPRENLFGSQLQKEQPLEILGGKTARWAAQTLGTEWGRQLISQSIWTDAWKLRLQSRSESLIVVDDLRFANEADAVREMGGIVVAITRQAVELQDRSTAHPSQRYWELKPDITVENDGNLRELGRHLDMALSPYLFRSVAAE